MNNFSPFNSLKTVVEGQNISGLNEFFRRMKRKSEDCPEEEDCDEVISPCCSSSVEVVFGSHPLMVRCSKCDGKFKLRDIVKKL